MLPQTVIGVLKFQKDNPYYKTARAGTESRQPRETLGEGVP